MALTKEDLKNIQNIIAKSHHSLLGAIEEMIDVKLLKLKNFLEADIDFIKKKEILVMKELLENHELRVCNLESKLNIRNRPGSSHFLSA